MVSDASYSKFTGVLGIGVVDLFTGREHSTSITINANHEDHIEYKAFLFSASIAMKNNYNNVVFVFDYKDLDIKKAKQYVQGKITCSQFLWLKRDYINRVDDVANTARKLREKLI